MGFHSDNQQNLPVGRPIMAESGSHAERAVMQASKVIAEIINDGAWKLRSQDSGPEYTAISGSVYVPLGRVRGMIVGVYDTTATPNSVYAVHYDLPLPTPSTDHGHFDWFAVGVMHPIWITRIRLTAKTTATKITLLG